MVRRQVRRAIEVHQNGQFDQAIRLYRAFLDKHPDNARVMHFCGQALHQSGKLGEGLEMLQGSVEIDPDNPIAQYSLGNVLNDHGRMEDARDCFRRATSLDPEFAAAFNNLGNALRDLGDAEAATDCYRRAIAIDNRLAMAHFNLGNALRDSRRLDDAIACYRDALAIDPDHALTLNNLGNAYRDQAETDLATECYRKAVAAEPGFALAHCNLATMFKDADQTVDALDAYRRVVALEPDHAVALHMIAALTANTTEKASDAFVRAVFDSYAPIFDAHLMDTLDYRAPAAMRESVDRVAGDRKFPLALDLGSGSGLVAEAFQGRIDIFHGADLSANMMAEARRKDLYAELHETELSNFLTTAGAEAYDIVLAGDVFIYLGALEEVFGGVAKCLRPGGLFCFSIERAAEEDYELRPSGHYAQSLDYIRRLAAENGFTVHAEDAVAVRHENDVPIEGAAVVLEKTAT